MDRKQKRTDLVTADDLLKFLQAKNVSMKCPHCAAEKWALAEVEETRGLALPTLRPDGNPSVEFMPMLTMVCGNCGYAWLMARGAYYLWLDGQEVAEKKDE